MTIDSLRARLRSPVEWARADGDDIVIRLGPVAGRLLFEAVEEVQAAAGEGWEAFPSQHGARPIIRLFRVTQTG